MALKTKLNQTAAFLITYALLVGFLFASPAWSSEVVSLSSSPKIDLRQALADITRERNALSERVDAVTAQHWFLTLYGVGVTALALFFGLRLLCRKPLLASADNAVGNLTDIFGASTSTKQQRNNATITIRNSATQEAESVSRLQTRSVLEGKKDHALRPGTASAAKVADGQVSKVVSSRLVPISDRKSSSDDQARGTESSTTAQATTVQRNDSGRLERQNSSGTTAVDVLLKPSVFKSVRHGFTLLEVMLAVAVLATVLSSVMASIYTMHTTQVLEQENARVQEISRVMTERLMGAQWDAIGRRDQTEPNLGAWSWHRRLPYTGQSAVPTMPPMRDGAGVPADQDLVALGIMSGPSQLENLRVYLEYYQGKVLDSVLTIGSTENPEVVWKNARETGSNRITEEAPADFAVSPTVQTASTMVFRIIITWTAYRAGERQHTALFARSK